MDLDDEREERGIFVVRNKVLIWAGAREFSQVKSFGEMNMFSEVFK